MNPPTSFFAAASAVPVAQQQGGPGLPIFLLQIGALVAIFYFVLIRPQRREKKAHQQMLQALGKGDRVLTNGGILGQVVHATERELTVKTAEDTRLVVDRGYVAAKLDADGKPISARPRARPRGGGGGGFSGVVGGE